MLAYLDLPVLLQGPHQLPLQFSVVGLTLFSVSNQTSLPHQKVEMIGRKMAPINSMLKKIDNVNKLVEIPSLQFIIDYLLELLSPGHNNIILCSFQVHQLYQIYSAGPYIV